MRLRFPKIGIRPIIDGRQGPLKLRDSLEKQVMDMAQAAKELFEKNLFYSDGTPVQVVIADSSIGRVPESAACAEKFRREGVDITLSVTPCWCYGSETMDMGIQWNRTPGCRLSGICFGYLCTKRLACIRHLWP